MAEKCKPVLTVASNLKYWLKMPFALLRKQESPVSLYRALPGVDTPEASL